MPVAKIDTYFRNQESTLDLLAKWHGQTPQDETVVARNGCNLAKELVEVFFVLFKTPLAVPDIKHLENQNINDNKVNIPSLELLQMVLFCLKQRCPVPLLCSPRQH